MILRGSPWLKKKRKKNAFICLHLARGALWRTGSSLFMIPHPPFVLSFFHMVWSSILSLAIMTFQLVLILNFPFDCPTSCCHQKCSWSTFSSRAITSFFRSNYILLSKCPKLPSRIRTTHQALKTSACPLFCSSFRLNPLRFAMADLLSPTRPVQGILLIHTKGHHIILSFTHKPSLGFSFSYVCLVVPPQAFSNQCTFHLSSEHDLTISN